MRLKKSVQSGEEQFQQFRCVNDFIEQQVLLSIKNSGADKKIVAASVFDFLWKNVFPDWQCQAKVRLFLFLVFAKLA